MQIIECKLTVSEGRDRKLIQKMKKTISSIPGCDLNSVDAYRRKSFTELSFFGDPETALLCAFRIIAIAEQDIDISKYDGDQLRIGAVDSLYISPISGLGLFECAEFSRKLGHQVMEQLGIPVFFYGSDVEGQGLRTLNDVRQLSAEGVPDIGGMAHKTAGFIAIGAGGTTSGADAIAIMLNIELRKDLAEARQMRSSPRRLRRIGGYLRTGGAVVRASLKSLIYSRSWSK